MAHVDLLALIGRDTQLKRTSASHGGEYSGGCPLCHAGTDRFKVWQQLQRWACLGPESGRNGCGRSGDAIQYLRERDGLTYREACERLGIDPIKGANGRGMRSGGEGAGTGVVVRTGTRSGGVSDRRGGEAFPAGPHAPTPLAPPNATWRAQAVGWADRCAALLWGEEGGRAREYLHRRGLYDGVLRACAAGYNPCDTWEERAQWGLPQPEGGDPGGNRGRGRIWIPRGITFPWTVEGEIWRLNIRRPLTPAQIAAGESKYIGPAGFANALYNAGSLRPGRPAVLVEGEIDALTVVQACGEQVAAVATGSTCGARRCAWVARLALAPVVLVAFDADKVGADGSPGAGDCAAAWWLNVLPNAARLRPLLHDVNSLPDAEDVASWVGRGLERAGHPAS